MWVYVVMRLASWLIVSGKNFDLEIFSDAMNLKEKKSNFAWW